MLFLEKRFKCLYLKSLVKIEFVIYKLMGIYNNLLE